MEMSDADDCSGGSEMLILDEKGSASECVVSGRLTKLVGMFFWNTSLCIRLEGKWKRQNREGL
jgi:hypothetical protein